MSSTSSKPHESAFKSVTPEQYQDELKAWTERKRNRSWIEKLFDSVHDTDPMPYYHDYEVNSGA